MSETGNETSNETTTTGALPTTGDEPSDVVAAFLQIGMDGVWVRDNSHCWPIKTVEYWIQHGRRKRVDSLAGYVRKALEGNWPIKMPPDPVKVAEKAKNAAEAYYGRLRFATEKTESNQDSLLKLRSEEAAAQTERNATEAQKKIQADHRCHANSVAVEMFAIVPAPELPEVVARIEKQRAEDAEKKNVEMKRAEGQQKKRDSLRRLADKVLPKLSAETASSQDAQPDRSPPE